MKSKLIRKVTTVVLSAAMIMSAMTITAPIKTVKAAPTTSSTLVWSDEFNGSSLDTSKWGYEIGTGSSGWGKISSALARLMEEDPTLSYQNNAETHQQVIGGLGEQHLDVVKAKLKNKFGVEIGLEAPRIAYRESIRKACQKQGRHKKQTGGHGQFGERKAGKVGPR